MQDFIKEEFELYKKLLQSKEILVEVENPKPPKVRDIRELQIFPPIYLVLLDELSYYNEKLFKAAVFTEEIELGWLGHTPILKLDSIKTVLIQLPFWVYLEESFLSRFSHKLGRISQEDWLKLTEYAERTIIPKTLQGEYIHLVMKRLMPYNTASLLDYLEKIGTYEETPLIIQIPQTLSKSLMEYSYAKAAASKNVFKGENFFAIIEKEKSKTRLIIYLPQDYIGKKVTIKLKGEKVFEGELTKNKILLDSLPVLLDYSFLEEELDVQI
jgi:hypothetical protein